MNNELDLKKLDDWYTAHFEELVENYPGKAVVVVNGEIIEVGDNERELDRRAREQYPGETPFVIRVLKEEELICPRLLLVNGGAPATRRSMEL